MRQAAQIKAGFYPAPPEAIDLALRHLRPPAEGPLAILDPCAGEGKALAQLASGLNADVVYAIELDEGRSATIAADHPDWSLLAPADFLNTYVRNKTFSFIWCNPPFDDEIGGGYRVENRFLDQATRLLRTRGVIAFVCPEHVMAKSDARETFLANYDHVSIVPFPEEHRRFNEVIVFAVKRATMIQPESRSWHDVVVRDHVYTLPSAEGPGEQFKKLALTEMELLDLLDSSPLRTLLRRTSGNRAASPPMSLATGHLALLLASGQLDGVVHPEGEDPHVVRGTARKVEYVDSQNSDVNSSGDVVTKTVYSERIVLTVRAIDAAGEIFTFAADDTKKEDNDAE